MGKGKGGNPNYPSTHPGNKSGGDRGNTKKWFKIAFSIFFLGGNVREVKNEMINSEEREQPDGELEGGEEWADPE